MLKSYKWMDGRMDGRKSLTAPILRPPVVLKIILIFSFFQCTVIFSKSCKYLIHDFFFSWQFFLIHMFKVDTLSEIWSNNIIGIFFIKKCGLMRKKIAYSDLFINLTNIFLNLSLFLRYLWQISATSLPQFSYNCVWNFLNQFHRLWALTDSSNKLFFSKHNLNT